MLAVRAVGYRRRRRPRRGLRRRRPGHLRRRAAPHRHRGRAARRRRGRLRCAESGPGHPSSGRESACSTVIDVPTSTAWENGRRDRPERPRHPLRLRRAGPDLVARAQDRARAAAVDRGAARPSATSASTCPTASSRPTRDGRRPGVDLESIAARERVTRHDVKARIEEFSALAGHEHIHKGMTSRDLTENVEQLQVRQSLALVRDRAVAALARLGRLAAEHETTGDGRPVPQRRRAGDHARQAVRDGRRRAAGRARAARGPDRPLPAARHQGPDGHRAGHARPARRRRRQAGRSSRSGSPHHLGFDRVLDQRRPGLPALARLRRRLRRSCSWSPARPTSRPRSG